MYVYYTYMCSVYKYNVTVVESMHVYCTCYMCV